MSEGANETAPKNNDELLASLHGALCRSRRTKKFEIY